MSIVVRKSWLARVQEDVLEPRRRIIDPHHHFFVRAADYPSYDLDALRADAATHGVEGTVYIECWENHRDSGPEHLRPVGETEWVDRVAREARRRPDDVQIDAIVGMAELRLGARVREVLDAHCAASELFRGVRQIAAWDESGVAFSRASLVDAALYADTRFRQGFAILSEMGLSFDAWHYHHQTPHLTALARAFPDARIVLDHFGTPLGIGPYAGRRAEIYAQWARDLSELAKCPNVSVKLGGMALPWTGFGFEQRACPPSSDELVRLQAHYYHHAIDTFGPQRCMFESNFPVDKCAVSYQVLWNAFKKIASRYTEAEKDDLFYGTAVRTYRLRSTSAKESP